MTGPLRPTDPLIGPPRGSVAQVMAFVHRAASPNALPDTAAYVTEVYRLAPLVGLDPAIVIAQGALETDNWRSPAWVERRNPAAIGITDGHDYAYTWANGTDAARAQIVHLCAYVYGELVYYPWLNPPRGLYGVIPGVPGFDIRGYAVLDPRIEAVAAAGWAGTVRTINDLTGKWGTDPRYAEKLCRRGNELYGWTQEEPTTMPTVAHEIPGLPSPIHLPESLEVRVRILPATQTNQRPGIPFWGGAASFYTQHETGNPRFGMDALAHQRYLEQGAPDNRGIPQQLSYHLTVDDKRVVFLLPLNEVGWHAGDGGGPGNFDSIASELCVNADADQQAARRNAAIVAAEIMRVLGIPIGNFKPHAWWFPKWCPAQLLNENAFDAQTRLVEHYLTSGAPPHPEPTVPVYPRGGLVPSEDGTDVRINGVTFWWMPREWRVLAPEGCPRHAYADPATPKTGPDLPQGATFRGKWLVHGPEFEGRNEWIVTEWGSRLPMRRLTPKIDLTL